jgi:membrane fusion protein, multidrug efflux system
MFITFLLLLGFISWQKGLIAAEKNAAMGLERPPVNTVLYELKPTLIQDKINLPGSIEAWTRLELFSKVAGSITEVLVTEGDHVKKGDIIARIEDNDYEIALKRATAAYKLAKAEFERDKTVYAKGVIPTAELDLKETSLQTAKADLENAELMLSRCTITAPMDSVIRRLDAKIGLLLSVGDVVAEMMHIDKVKGVVGIPESDIPAIRKLNEVELTLKALDGLTVKGKKHFLAPAPDSAARLYRLELEIDNSSGDILPGMFVRANVVKKSMENAVVIPLYSVISRNSEQYVFVEKNGVAVKRNVTLGIMENWMVQVTEGLTSGEKVLIEGHRDVENGQKIKIAKIIDDVKGYTL